MKYTVISVIISFSNNRRAGVIVSFGSNRQAVSLM